MIDRICSIEDCGERSRRRGWCNRHYHRWREHGDPLAGGPNRILGDPVQRFWSKVDKTETCWNWTGVTHKGYGNFAYAGSMVKAHRFSFELANGHLPPEEMVIDHICHNRRCVRPEHLRVVTRKQNGENRVGPQTNNTSGALGVTWDAGVQKWRAQVKHNGSRIYVGIFDSLADADAAARAKRNELFTHNDRDRV